MTTKNKHKKKGHSNVTINSNVKDYGNDPFFVKKANESKRFLEKHGFPKAFQRQAHSA